jgi:hypothetical protein
MENKEKIENVNATLSWVERVFGFVKKAGIQNILITLMMVFLVAVVGQFVFNPEGLIKRYEQIVNEQHTESVIKRLNNEPAIRENLIQLKSELNADRVYILETHNGGANLAGLPFLYVDLTYAEPKSAYQWLESEYRNVRLARYPWASELYQNSFYAEPIDYLENLDPELYYRLKNEDVVYMAAIMMYGTYNPSGVIGVVYTNKDNIPDKSQIRRVLTKYTSTFAILFNNE